MLRKTFIKEALDFENFVVIDFSFREHHSFCELNDDIHTSPATRHPANKN